MPITPEPKQTLEVYYAYAPQDELLGKELEKHLILLERAEVTSGWHQHKMLPGAKRTETITTFLNAADIILLLLSPDFLASDELYHGELQRAQERSETEGVRVIPILLRPCDWKEHPFLGTLQALPMDERPVTAWTDRDHAFEEIARGIRLVVEEARKAVLAPPTKKKLLWNIPYQRNPFFTGREKLLTDLHDNLSQTSAAALTQRQAIHGLGGIGKTQTAIEYAYRYREEYTAVLWTSAATRDLLITSFVTLAGLLHLSEKDAPDQMLTVEAVKGWLTTHSGWLLILDNADDLAMVSEFLPVGQTGHILLTTRAQAAGSIGIAHSIPVESMDKQEGVQLLLKRAKVLLPDTPLDQEAQSQAQAIVDALGGLPLAIDQAGAYIEESGCSLSQYLAFYRTRRRELLQRRSGLPAEHPEPVATTWSLSFQKVKEANPAASELLQVCAFLDADTIPEDLFTKGAKHLGKVLSPVASDPFHLNEAIQVLRQYSLIRRQTPTHTLSVHRLVQAVLQDSMTAKQQRQWAERVIHALLEASPEMSYGNPSAYEPYLPHLLHCATLIEDYHLSLADAADLLHNLGLYFYYSGRYTDGEPFYQRALTIKEQVLGAEHPDTDATMYELASLYQEQGQYDQAQELYQRALTIKEQALGAEHPDTAATMHALASLYRDQGQYDQAQELYQRVLTIKRQAWGAEHPDTAATMHALANLYQEQGQYKSAKGLYQRVLKIKQQALGAEHPETALTLWGLAALYERQGQYTRAEPLYRQALAIMEKAKPLHPHTTQLREDYHDLLRKMERKG